MDLSFEILRALDSLCWYNNNHNNIYDNDNDDEDSGDDDDNDDGDNDDDDNDKHRVPGEHLCS